MLSGKSYPHPRQEIWVGAYTDKKSEYFELRTVTRQAMVPILRSGTNTHRLAPQSLTSSMMI